LATFRSEQLWHQRAELTDERSGKACSAILYPTKAKLTDFENTRSNLWQRGCIRPGVGRSLADRTGGTFLVNNEQIIRKAYERAEKVDVKGWVECFTSDGTFTDMSIGVTYRGPDGPTGLGKTVEVYAKAFPDMHRDLYRFFNAGDVVVVELAPQGTHKGPLPTPMGILPPTGKRMDAPCCDVFRLVNGKIQSFNCYPSGTVIFAQLGVLSNIEAAIAHS
jgi:ketosteroid isomerase-like protein